MIGARIKVHRNLRKDISGGFVKIKWDISLTTRKGIMASGEH